MTTSRTEVMFPCRTTTWCINRFPYRKQRTFLKLRLLWTRNGIIAEITGLRRVKSEQESGGDTPSKIRRQASSFCHTNGLVLSQVSELEKKFKTYTGRVVLRGDIASKVLQRHMWRRQKPRALFQDFLAFLDKQVMPWAHTHTSRIERRTRTYSSFGRRLSKDSDHITRKEEYHKHRIQLTIQLYRWCAIFTVIHFWERNVEKNSAWKKDGKESTDGNALTFIAKCSSSCAVYVDDMKMAGKLRTCRKYGQHCKRKSIWKTQYHYFDQVYLGCTQRAVQVNTRIVMEKQKLFPKLISTNTGVKIRHGRSHSKVCWALLRIGAQGGWSIS